MEAIKEASNKVETSSAEAAKVDRNKPVKVIDLDFLSALAQVFFNKFKVLNIFSRIYSLIKPYSKFK